MRLPGRSTGEHRPFLEIPAAGAQDGTGGGRAHAVHEQAGAAA
ncbi:hypothetical protein [Streptomyces sp. TR02-1]